jgi:hypothetical protein
MIHVEANGQTRQLTEAEWKDQALAEHMARRDLYEADVPFRVTKDGVVTTEGCAKPTEPWDLILHDPTTGARMLLLCCARTGTAGSAAKSRFYQLVKARRSLGVLQAFLGYTPRLIAASAFKGSLVSRILLPSSVTAIKDNAFTLSNNIRAIRLPTGVTEVGFAAFAFCESLTHAFLPPSLHDLKEAVFRGCERLEAIDMPAVKRIGACAFYGCESLAAVRFPPTLRTIGAGAFFGCTALGRTTVPGTVVTVETQAFFRCKDVRLENPASYKDA